MKVLHILFDAPDDTALMVIREQSSTADVKVIEYFKGDVSAESLVDEIFSADKCISWNR